MNKSLRSLFLEVRRSVSEEDGALYYGLVRARLCMMNRATFTTPNTLLSLNYCGNSIVEGNSEQVDVSVCGR